MDDRGSLFDQQTFRDLQALARGRDSKLTFFVGAGISSGDHGLPSTAALIEALIRNAAAGDPRLAALTSAPISSPLGFEMVLNDLWQICPAALAAFYGYLARLDAAAQPSIAHAFLANWLGDGGLVLTTNYDRLIERLFTGSVRFESQSGGDLGFEDWRRDLTSGTLFKLHGSLERTSTCLGALEHVGTAIDGARAELVSYVFRELPVCIVGWRGADPDIPPVVRAALTDRSRDVPLYWVHHSPGSVNRLSPLLRHAALIKPVFADADTFFAHLDVSGAAQRHLTKVTHASAADRPKPLTAFRGETIELAPCDRSGLARFVGIALRRAKRESSALAAFRLATRSAQSLSTWAAAEQERALTIWASAGGQEKRELAAREVVRRVVVCLSSTHSVEQRINATFGLLSMTVSLARNRPSMLGRVPGLLRAQRRAIAAAKAHGADETDVAVSEALTDLYAGRFRLRLAGNGRLRWGPMASWILRPYRAALANISRRPIRSLHARFDIMAGIALAAARLGKCGHDLIDLEELDRLSLLLTDPRRVAYWAVQRRQIKQRCA